MAGLSNILKMYGRMQVQGVMWVWDYVNEKPRVESEMSKEEINASEIVKWAIVKAEMDRIKASKMDDTF